LNRISNTIPATDGYIAATDSTFSGARQQTVTAAIPLQHAAPAEVPNTKVHRSVPMGPLAYSDGDDAPRLIDELVPCEAAVVDDVIVGFEDAVREAVVAHELPHVLDWVEFRASWRQRHQGDVGRHDQFGRSVPSGLIEQEDCMRAWGNVEGDFLEMHAHRLAVATGHDDAGGLAFGGADRAEQPSGGATLVLRR